MTLENNRAPLQCLFMLCTSFGNHLWIHTGVTVRKHPICCFKLCATFYNHWWIQTGVTVRKRPIWVKIYDFFSRVSLKFDRWPWKTIGHLFNACSCFVHHLVTICEFTLELQSGNTQYVASSFVQHFITIGEFKLELQSGNAQFGSKSTIFLAVCPWNLTDDLEKH